MCKPIIGFIIILLWLQRSHISHSYNYVWAQEWKEMMLLVAFPSSSYSIVVDVTKHTHTTVTNSSLNQHTHTHIHTDRLTDMHYLIINESIIHTKHTKLFQHLRVLHRFNHTILITTNTNYAKQKEQTTQNTHTYTHTHIHTHNWQ